VSVSTEGKVDKERLERLLRERIDKEQLRKGLTELENKILDLRLEDVTPDQIVAEHRYLFSKSTHYQFPAEFPEYLPGGVVNPANIGKFAVPEEATEASARLELNDALDAIKQKARRAKRRQIQPQIDLEFLLREDAGDPARTNAFTDKESVVFDRTLEGGTQEEIAVLMDRTPSAAGFAISAIEKKARGEVKRLSNAAEPKLKNRIFDLLLKGLTLEDATAKALIPPPLVDDPYDKCRSVEDAAGVAEGVKIPLLVRWGGTRAHGTKYSRLCNSAPMVSEKLRRFATFICGKEAERIASGFQAAPYRKDEGARAVSEPASFALRNSKYQRFKGFTFGPPITAPRFPSILPARTCRYSLPQQPAYAGRPAIAGKPGVVVFSRSTKTSAGWAFKLISLPCAKGATKLVLRAQAYQIVGEDFIKHPPPPTEEAISDLRYDVAFTPTAFVQRRAQGIPMEATECAPHLAALREFRPSNEESLKTRHMYPPKDPEREREIRRFSSRWSWSWSEKEKGLDKDIEKEDWKDNLPIYVKAPGFFAWNDYFNGRDPLGRAMRRSSPPLVLFGGKKPTMDHADRDTQIIFRCSPFLFDSQDNRKRKPTSAKKK
jgi:hypothetical protein